MMSPPEVPKPRARAIAMYLPQFHPTPENDRWWGTGFTEWTNTAKARPLFRGHYQPRIPADLGFYDLRVSETRVAQAEMARHYGIEAFCYYHYWFAGKRMLSRPFEEVLASGEPDFPFCLCWANQTWSGIWHGEPKRVLIEQTYPGLADHRTHFEHLLPAFADRRHITIDGRPLFVIYAPNDLPEADRTIAQWKEWGVKAGLPELYFACVTWGRGEEIVPKGFDGRILTWRTPKIDQYPYSQPLKKIKRFIDVKRGVPSVYDYERAVDAILPNALPDAQTFPTVLPNWDNSPRSGVRGLTLRDSTPEKFRVHLRRAIHLLDGRPADHQLLFIKSWNEWAEGNHLEPDRRFGHQYLEVVRSELGR